MKPTNINTVHWLAYNALFLSEHFLGEEWYAKLLGNTEKRLYKKISSHIANNTIVNDFKVIEHFGPDYPEPDPHPDYPVIYRGIAKKWTCSNKWTFDFFSQKYGDQDVTLINNAGLVKD